MNASRLVSSPSLAWLRRLSHRAWWLHALLIGQLALLPCPLSRGVWVEVDTDGDGLVDSGYEDGVSEGLAEDAQAVVEPDADGDGLSDTEEAALGSDACNPDSDSDGLTDADEAQLNDSNPLSADSDGDGISDYNAFYGNTAVDTFWAGEGATAYDWDGDGLHDPVDPDPYSTQNLGDADGDHVPDPTDSHPLDPMLWCDWNGSGINDDAEVSGADLDGDGVSDATDSHPADPGLDNDWNDNGVDDEHEDGDGDGVSNLQDSHPNANNLWCDWNGNGVNDDAEAAVAAGHAIAGSDDPAVSEAADPNAAILQDRDGDGYGDAHDSHPDDPGLWNDHNGNGFNDDTEAPPDTDRDGIADAWDAAPADQDNDGLTDTEEWTMGTDPAEADSDGDGLGDGEEVHAGTDPLSVDTDGDGLTDSEELFAYHSDPLEPTAITLVESVSPPEAGDTPPAGVSGLRVSHLIPDPGSESGQRRAEHADGGSLVFPSRSAQKDRSDLTKTLLLAWAGETSLAGLSARLSGADAAHFQVGPLSSDELAPGAERACSITFLAPAAATSARTATLTFYGGPEATPLFVLNLRSVVSAGLWTTNDQYFFADYTDSDADGIPDLVEAMYAPLTVTATGDLDGDGTNNLDQYLAGRDLRAHAKSNDVDGDGLTNATEDAWNAAYPGRLNKYYFADAFADPDGDGLLTLEELTCTWGGQKDPHAVATHPFVAGSAPPSAAKTAHYKTTHRKPPKTAPAAEAAVTASGPLLSRCSLYARWMNDGLLRRASHETARANGGRLPADFFTPERVVHATTTAQQTLQGSDHLPRGYLTWLGRQTPAITLPAPVPAMPDSELVQNQLLGLQLPDASDADADALPTAWEAAYALNWRSAADSHLEHALETLNQRLASLAGDLADPIRSAEHEAVAEVRNRLLAAQTSWPVITYPATVQGQPQPVETRLVPVYDSNTVEPPASLTAAAAADGDRRSAWIAQCAVALDWQMRTGLDPDHDGLMNRDEYQLGLSPHLPDYEATGERDSDGDGFINAIELATGTDHLNSRKRPDYAIEILTPVKERTGATLQPLALPVQTVLRGPKGSWPLGSQSLSVTAPNTQCLLAWEQDGRALDWHPKTVPAGVTDEQGRITLHVHPGWKKGGLRLTFRSTPGAGLPAGLKTATAIGALTLTAPAEDSDTDGLPDVWEARPAQGPGDPAHSLSKASALDAEAGPQHFGYHPSTPAERLPATVQELLNEWKAAEADLGYLPEYPAMTAAPTPLAVPFTDDAVTVARHKILALIDPDHDGWSNRVEFENGTHPQLPDNPATATRDTDGDGAADVLERQEGTNPFDAGSLPVLSLTDASLRVVWGSGQSAAPGSLAPQPVVVQLVRANGVLLKRVALEANCPGGHFAVPAVKGKNVQWQPGTLKLMTDAQGKASFHFWTPSGASSPWQIQVALASHPGINARVTILNAGSSSSGSSGGSTAGPGVADRQPNTGDSPGFSNSHAPFVIRFVDWKGGTVSRKGSASGSGTGGTDGVAYRASKQGMRWELAGDGAPTRVPAGSAYEESIGTHTEVSAQTWMAAWNQTAPQSYSVKRHNAQWIEGALENGVYAETYRVENGAERFVSRSLAQPFGSEEDYHSYMNSPHADLYEVAGGDWVEVLSVYPEEEQPGGTGTVPQDQPQDTTKHEYLQQVPQTFSTVEGGIDTTRQETADPVGRLNSLGSTIRLKDKRLPNGQRRLADGEYDWDGIVARSSMQLTKVEPAESGGVPTYSGHRSQGKVVIAWDNDYPVSLSEKSREAWLKRFLVLVSHPDGTDSPKPLGDYLTLTSGADSAPIELNPGTLNAETTPDKTVTLRIVPLEIAVDANRDGEITFDGKDLSCQDKPYTFWVNWDCDRGAVVDYSDWEEDDQYSGWPDDSLDGIISCRRDLEDFTRLWANLQALKSIAPVEELQNPNYKLQLRWEPIDQSPAINVFRPVEVDGGRRYLTDEDIGYQQCHGDHARILFTSNSSNLVSIPREAWPDLSSDTPILHLLFEGREKGKGKLMLEVIYDQSVRFAFPPVFLNLVDVKDMYETWTVGDADRPGVNRQVWPSASPRLISGRDLAKPNQPNEKDYFLFVHGWNMSVDDKDYFASTTYKRLWHHGYQGRFGIFCWPTFYFDTVVPSTDNFDASEERAWNSASQLKWLIQKLSSTYSNEGVSRVRLYAHSMGNVVASECLRQGAPVHTYISAQAAVSAHAWDSSTAKMPFTYGLGPSTPDIYGYYWNSREASEPHTWQNENNPSYMDASYMPLTPRYINHYNPLDWALSYGRWQINQMLKPDVRYAYGSKPPHDISNNSQRFYTFGIGSTWTDLVFPFDRFQIIAYAAESHSYATGQDGATGGMFGMAVDLNSDFAFGSAHKGHSAQFRSFIQKRWMYWMRVLDDMQINYPSKP